MKQSTSEGKDIGVLERVGVNSVCFRERMKCREMLDNSTSGRTRKEREECVHKKRF